MLALASFIRSAGVDCFVIGGLLFLFVVWVDSGGERFALGALVVCIAGFLTAFWIPYL